MNVVRRSNCVQVIDPLLSHCPPRESSTLSFFHIFTHVKEKKKNLLLIC